MTNIVVFEGQTEVIIAAAANVNAVVRDWFLNGGRSLDDYDVFLADGQEGFAITTGTSFDGRHTDFDITELMPNALREALVDAGQLTEE